ncbi:hypothetical protein D3C73_927310 [compost metagenome]
MHVEEHVKLWNLVSIKIWDVRHHLMSVNGQVNTYHLPASGFLYTIRGSAEITLDGISHSVEKIHVLHGGKGAYLEILCTEDRFEYYLVLYRASLPTSSSREFQALLMQHYPFHIKYAFIPNHLIKRD